MRLSWDKPEAKGQGRRRALPPGEYALVGYRILKRDDAGHDWHISATSPRIRVIEVVGGASQVVEVDETITMNKGVHSKRVSLAVRGDGGAGLSIYRNELRIPMGYRLDDAHGHKLSQGKINYG